MKKLGAVLLAVLVFAAALPSAQAAFPDRPIRMIASSAPGGGTDTWGRKLCALLSRELDCKIMVNNMVGAGGATGTAYAWGTPHDGYTWCSANDSSPAIPVMTGFEATASRWEYFVGGGSPGVLCVNAQSGIKNFDEYLAKAKAEPGSPKLAVCAGSVWFSQAAIIANKCGVAATLVPIAGTQPAIISCVSGEATSVIASMGEVANFVASGRLIPIVMTGEKAGKLDKFDIPAIVDKLPSYKPYTALKQWQGIQIPADCPEDVKQTIGKAFAKIMASPEMEEFRAAQYGELMNLTGQEALDFAMDVESITSYLLWELKIGKFDPQKLGIGQK